MLAELEQKIFVHDPWSEHSFVQEITRTWTEVTIAYSPQNPGEILGYCSLFLSASLQSDIHTIAVAPESRGQKIGTFLLNHMQYQAKQHGSIEMLLEVRKDNAAAIALYEQHGFQQINVRKNYYESDNMDAIIMLKKLDPPTTLPAETATTKTQPAREPLILAIETSCDETGVGIVRGNTILANTVASSMLEHARFGGVVPEIAARAHVEAIDHVLVEAVKEAGVSLHDIDVIGVTAGPGLAGALMVGVAAAKGLATALDKPLYAVNHLVGHVAADLLHDEGVIAEAQAAGKPVLALLVSGGHTELLLIRDLASDVELLGETIDDAAGEAFDKVARQLGLGYPGGPEISRVAAHGDPNAIAFPRGLTQHKDQEQHAYNFSFSGLKTAVSRYLVKLAERQEEPNIADIAASFQEAVVDVLVKKTLLAAKSFGVEHIVLGGGVAANRELRNRLIAEAEARSITVSVPPLPLCTDNGAMMAAITSVLVRSGAAPSSDDFGVDPNAPAAEIQLSTGA